MSSSDQLDKQEDQQPNSSQHQVDFDAGVPQAANDAVDPMFSTNDDNNPKDNAQEHLDTNHNDDQQIQHNDDENDVHVSADFGLDDPNIFADLVNSAVNLLQTDDKDNNGNKQEPDPQEHGIRDSIEGEIPRGTQYQPQLEGLVDKAKSTEEQTSKRNDSEIFGQAGQSTAEGKADETKEKGSNDPDLDLQKAIADALGDVQKTSVDGKNDTLHDIQEDRLVGSKHDTLKPLIDPESHEDEDQEMTVDKNDELNLNQAITDALKANFPEHKNDKHMSESREKVNKQETTKVTQSFVEKEVAGRKHDDNLDTEMKEAELYLNEAIANALKATGEQLKPVDAKSSSKPNDQYNETSDQSTSDSGIESGSDSESEHNDPAKAKSSNEMKKTNSHPTYDSASGGDRDSVMLDLNLTQAISDALKGHASTVEEAVRPVGQTSSQQPLSQLELDSVIQAAFNDRSGADEKQTDTTGGIGDSDLELSKAITEALESHAGNESNTSIIQKPQHVEEPENPEHDLSKAIQDALEETRNQQIGPVAEPTTSNTDEDALQEALAQMVQSVVDTNLFPDEQSKKPEPLEKKTPVKPKAKKATKPTTKDTGNADIEQFQWNDMMEKAMEMAMEDPEHLISSMNIDDDPSRKGQNTQSSSSSYPVIPPAIARPLSASITSAAQSGRVPSMAAVTAAARKGLAQMAAQHHRSSIPSGMLQFSIPAHISPNTLRASEDQTRKAAPHSNKKKTPTKNDLPPNQPASQKFQKSTTPGASFASPMKINDGQTDKLPRKDPKDGKALSIAETLELERRKIGGSPSFVQRPNVTIGRQTAGSVKEYFLDLGLKSKNSSSVISNAMARLDLLNLSPTDILKKITPHTVETIKAAVLKAVNNLKAPASAGSFTKSPTEKASKPMAPLSEAEEKERIRIENRERKKRWRITNIERNRDNDLRARVIKRANQIFPNPADEQSRKNWIASEFEKRRIKRMKRNGIDADSVGGDGETDDRSSLNHGPEDEKLKSRDSSVGHIPSILKDAKLFEHITSVFRGLTDDRGSSGILSSATSAESKITSAATTLAAAYAASHDSFDESVMIPAINSLVSILNDEMPLDSKSTLNPPSKNTTPVVSGLPEGAVSLFRVSRPQAKASLPISDPSTPKPPTLNPDLSLTSYVKSNRTDSIDTLGTSIADIRNLSLTSRSGEINQNRRLDSTATISLKIPPPIEVPGATFVNSIPIPHSARVNLEASSPKLIPEKRKIEQLENDLKKLKSSSGLIASESFDVPMFDEFDSSPQILDNSINSKPLVIQLPEPKTIRIGPPLKQKVKSPTPKPEHAPKPKAAKPKSLPKPKPQSKPPVPSIPPSPPPPPVPQVRLPQYLKPESNSIKSSITSPVVKAISASPSIKPASSLSNSPSTPSSPSVAGGIFPSRPSSKGIGSSNTAATTVGLTVPGMMGLRRPGAFRKPPGFTNGNGGNSNESIKKPFGGITPLKRI